MPQKVKLRRAAEVLAFADFQSRTVPKRRHNLPRWRVKGRMDMIRWAVRILVIAVAVYCFAFAALVLFQRRLMYFPGGPAGPAAAHGLPHAETLRLQTADGESIVAWYQPAALGKPLFLYFHGNGGTLATRAGLLRQLAQDGSGFLGIDYRGYGGSSGAPTERGILQDGHAAYAKARALGYDASRIVLLGESLGTAVAVAVAADEPARALVLDSAFSSTVDVAAAQYPIFPVHLAMKDTCDSASRIGRVTVPKLFLHGTADMAIPIAFDRRLYAAAPKPKTFIELPGRGHITLASPDVVARMKEWLAALK